jgi:hypothetical protein
MTDLTMWWPSPEAFDDLVIKEVEVGFTLSAPDDSECGEWLEHWNQSPEHLEFFENEFIKSLTNHADFILKNHGEN